MRLFPIFSLVVFLGCSDANDKANVADSDTAAKDGQQTGTALAGQAKTELSADDPKVVDAKIGSIMHALNGGEIMVAQAALSQNPKPSATDFANMMVTMHGDNDATLQSKISNEGLAFRDDNTVTPQLMADAASTKAALQGAGANVTHDYLVSQVKMHAAALVLAGTLVDLAVDPALESYLKTTQSVISKHELDARDRLGSL